MSGGVLWMTPNLTTKARRVRKLIFLNFVLFVSFVVKAALSFLDVPAVRWLLGGRHIPSCNAGAI